MTNEHKNRSPENIFTDVVLNLQPINGLEPIVPQPQETKVDFYFQVPFSLYKCSECGQIQGVIINLKKNRPIMNPKCFNRFCTNYGYNISSDEQRIFNNEHSGKIINWSDSLQFCVLTKMSEESLICTSLTDPNYMIVDMGFLKFAGYQNLSLSSSALMSSDT